MPSKHIAFKKTALDKLPNAEAGKRDYYYDTEQEGLMLQVTASGSKTYYVYKRMDGRPQRLKLAKYTEMTITEARKASKEAVGKIAQGRNPYKERKAVKDEMTLSELFNRFIERYAKQHKKTWEEDVNNYNRYLTHWDNRQISQISRDDVMRLHSKLGDENGIYAANRLLALLRTLYNKALDWDWEGRNPALQVKPFKEKSRERFLQPEEMQRFFAALEEESNEVVRDFLKVSLFTGARKSNVLSMRWSDISLKGQTWTIPDTKNGESHTVPLLDEVITILKDRQKCSEFSQWVFPSNHTAEKHLTDPKKVWAQIMKRAKIENLRMHDLRRTMGSYQSSLGANGFIIGKTLGHKSSRATDIYARLNLDPVKESMKQAVGAMVSHAEGE